MKRFSLNLFYFGRRRFPLADALQFLHSSIEIVRRYIIDRDYTPQEEDHILLIKIINEAQDLRLAAMQAYHQFDERVQHSEKLSSR